VHLFSCAIFITWIHLQSILSDVSAESRMLIGLQSKRCDMFLYIRPFVCKLIPIACFGRRHFSWSPITKAKYRKRLHKMKFAWKRAVYLCQPYTWSHRFESFPMATMTWLTVTEYLCHKWHRYVPFVVITIRSFPHSWLITGIVTRVTQHVPHVEHELLTLPEHMSSPPVWVGFVLLDF
jgi:hypothetical protein